MDAAAFSYVRFASLLMAFQERVAAERQIHARGCMRACAVDLECKIRKEFGMLDEFTEVNQIEHRK